ncbi:MAG TPA: diguanylate cyclase, partial [Candidatus Limnocylindrales bacterium]
MNPAASRPARILLVDDSAADVEVALRAFRELRLTNDVLVAHDGAEALDLLLGRRVRTDGSPYPLPDLLLLDLAMGGIDGLEVLRRVREAPVLRRIPVVFLVASAEEAERARRTTRGVIRCLVKPLALDELLDVVRALEHAWLTVTVEAGARPARRPVGGRQAEAAQAPGPLRLLMVEDSPTDAEVVALRLEEEGLDFDWDRVDTEEGFRVALGTSPDIILCDWTLPRFSGLRALAVRQELGLDVPFIIVSGRVGEEAAIDALQQGADDYVLKDRLARLGTAIRRALETRRQRREHARADEELRLAAAWFEATAEGVMVTDPNGSILAVNRAFTEITGYTELEVVGRNPRMLKSGRQDEAFYRAMWGGLRASGHWRGELWNRRKNGEVYPEWSTISAVRDAEGQVTRYVEVFSDIGEFKKAQADIDFLVHHDALTGLPNRALLQDRLAEAIRRASGQDSVMAVAILDLDRFGDVNDTLGHLAGDDVLRVLAKRLTGALGPQDTLGRFGGDDFAVVLGRVGSADHAATRVRDLQERLARPVRAGSGQVVVTASAGISIHPADGEDPAILLRNAETALRELSPAGRNTIGFFEAEMAAKFAERVGLEQDLRGALGRGELTVSYQPQLGLADGALVGAEA